MVVRKHHLSLRSSNVKTGDIAVSTSSRETCWDGCPLQKNGCYADSGPMNIHWTKVTEGSRGVSFEEFLELIKNLPRQIWRYGQAGDLPGDNADIDHDQLIALAKANDQRPVIAFTHKPPTEKNLALIREAAELGFQINLSGNSLAHADQLMKHDLPVVVVVNSKYERKNSKGEWTETVEEYKERISVEPTTTPDGHKFAVCPATWLDTNCKECKLCSRARKVIIAFPAHGSRKARVNETVT